MSEEIKEKFYGGEAAAREAFEELCAMVDQFHVRRLYCQKIASRIYFVHFSLNGKNVVKQPRHVWIFCVPGTPD